jgi:hypothetical protein
LRAASIDAVAGRAATVDVIDQHQRVVHDHADQREHAHVAQDAQVHAQQHVAQDRADDAEGITDITISGCR